MNIRTLSIALLCLLVPVAGMRAEDKASPASSALDDQMEEINAAYRRLGRQVSDASKNADSLKQVGVIQKHAAAALKLEPKKKADLPTAEQAKFVEAYKAKM